MKSVKRNIWIQALSLPWKSFSFISFPCSTKRHVWLFRKRFMKWIIKNIFHVLHTKKMWRRRNGMNSKPKFDDYSHVSSLNMHCPKDHTLLSSILLLPLNIVHYNESVNLIKPCQTTLHVNSRTSISILSRLHTCRPSFVVRTVAECSYGGEILNIYVYYNRKIYPIRESIEVSEAVKRARSVLQRLWEVYKYHVKHDMHWTLWILHSHHHFCVELRILQSFDPIAQANRGSTAYVDCQ